MSHNSLKSQTADADERVHNLLSELDINLDYTNKLPLNERLKFFINVIPGAADAYSRPSLEEHTSFSGETSIVLLKPEIFPREDDILEALNERGYAFKTPRLIYPRSDQWYGVYGYMLNKHPDIIQNYIMQRALGLKIVEVADMDETRVEILNKDTGKAYIENKNTIRGSVSRKIMSELGFLAMSGYASIFDPCRTIADNTNAEFVFHCYNGIHTPQNASESVSNMNILKS